MIRISVIKEPDAQCADDAQVVHAFSVRKYAHFPGSRAERKSQITGGFMKTGLTRKQKVTEADEQGGLRFEIDKHRIGIRLTAPYSPERRAASSQRAKETGIGARK